MLLRDTDFFREVDFVDPEAFRRGAAPFRRRSDGPVKPRHDPLPRERGPRPFHRQTPKRSFGRRKTPAGADDLRALFDGRYAGRGRLAAFNERHALKVALKAGLLKSPWFRALDALEIAADLAHGLNPESKTFVIPGMRMIDGPYSNAPVTATGEMNLDWAGSHGQAWQLTGQALGPMSLGSELNAFVQWPAGGSTPPEAIIYHVYMQGTARRGAEHSSWMRNPGEVHSPFVVQVKTLPAVGLAVQPMLNPNLVRWSPLITAPLADTLLQTQLVQARLAAELDATPEFWRVTVTARGSQVVRSTSSNTKNPSDYRAPPVPKEKESPKRRTLLARFGQMLWKGFNDLSEQADIVDAVYKALPCSVQKRWDREDRKMVDKFGQGGLNGADWKLQALYHNWHLLDVDEAWQNIAWNVLEDMFYGLVHGNAPGPQGLIGMDAQFKEFNDLLKHIPLPQPKDCKKAGTK